MENTGKRYRNSLEEIRDKLNMEQNEQSESTQEQQEDLKPSSTPEQPQEENKVEIEKGQEKFLIDVEKLQKAVTEEISKQATEQLEEHKQQVDEIVEEKLNQFLTRFDEQVREERRIMQESVISLERWNKVNFIPVLIRDVAFLICALCIATFTMLIYLTGGAEVLQNHYEHQKTVIEQNVNTGKGK